MDFQLDVMLYILVFVVVLVILIRMARQARNAEQAATSMATESPHEGMLLKFVEDGSGKRIGETVAVEGGDFILKDAKGFLAVPTTIVAEQGTGLKLSGPFDESEARRKGEAWRERSHKLITYSESEIPKDEPEP